MTLLIKLDNGAIGEVVDTNTLIKYGNVKISYEDFEKFEGAIIHSMSEVEERPIWVRIDIPDKHLEYFKNTYPEYLI